MRFHRNDCITQHFLLRPRNNHVVYNRRGTTSKREWKKSIKKKTPVLRITELSGSPPPPQCFIRRKKEEETAFILFISKYTNLLLSITANTGVLPASSYLVKARGYEGTEQSMAACKDHCSPSQLPYETSYAASTP